MPDYNYLDKLNFQQREAVTYCDGPALVIAGAGSGKTRVLTYKILDLLSHGYEPYRLLALTFTNKAAREMKERITQIVGEKVASKIKMGTFHSIFLNILRRHASLFGYKDSFTIYDTSDSKSLIKMIVKDLKLDDKIYKPGQIASFISNQKNSLVSPEQYISDSDNYILDKRLKRPLFGEIYRIYCERCKLSNAMDFDDILVYMNLLLRDNPDVRRHYQEFFRYILVDEYQDTNFAQHLIISQLANDENQVFVVGDDAQSIYSFRGANINNILNLDKRFPQLKIFKLEQNYRSTQNIVKAAESLIDKNTHQIKKTLFSENAEGEKVKVIKAYSDLEEAFIVSNNISQLKFSNHDEYGDFAILYRTNAQSRVLEESLRKRNIPYKIYGGLSFYSRKEVKDLIAYFRMSVNPDDDEALRRIINLPARGIGETTLNKLSTTASERKISIWNVINNVEPSEIGLNKNTAGKINNFKNLIQEFIDENNSDADAYSTGQLIFNRSGLLTMLESESTPESVSRRENLFETLAGLKEYVETEYTRGNPKPDMKGYLSEVLLYTDLDEKEDEDTPKVSLMTVHASKGLEFKHVFVVGVEEDLFPAALSKDSNIEVEEERRLLYVAMTRAKETCILTFAGNRFRNGQTVITNPSRFIKEFNPKYLEMTGSAGKDNLSFSSSFRQKLDQPQPYFSQKETASKVFLGKRSTEESHEDKEDSNQNNDNSPELIVGMTVRHDKFGKGKILKLGNLQGQKTISVDFGAKVGIKNLLIKFAKIKIEDE